MITWSTVSPSGRSIACLCAVAVVAVLGFGVPLADAVGSSPEAENFIPRFGEQGSGAGQLAEPAGIAVALVTGDVYVSDEANDRVSEFSPWGHFIRAFGWGVADGVSEELQACTTVCFKGLEGTGAGEFETPDDMTVDAGGDVYVGEAEFGSDKRVQKFSASGQFLLMFGGEVDKTQVHKREEQEAKAEPVTVTTEEEDVCTAASGDQCGAGVAGTGHGQFSAGSGIALFPDGTVALADRERIEEFEPDGAYKAEVALPGKTVRQLAVDPTTNDFYVTFTGTEENLYRLSPTGASLGGFLEEDAHAPATDQAGNVYVGSNDSGRIVEFDHSGKKLAEFDDPKQRLDEARIDGLATNSIGDLYVSNSANGFLATASFLSAYGPGPVVFEPPPAVPPTIESEYAISADIDSAVVQAHIDPHFWGDSTYYVQYGTGDCEVSACVSRPAAPGSKLTSGAVDESVTSDVVLLSGLQPDTTYHYRFVSVSSGGGPVFGPDHTFTTFPEPVANTGCPNQVLRTGFSAPLADCRAYEMVSPIDKDNGDILDLLDGPGYDTGLYQSATGGDKFTYSSYRAFDDAKTAQYMSQYIASRDPVSGWATEAISPAQQKRAFYGTLTFDNEYTLFSSDLSSAWLYFYGEPALAPGAVEDVPTLYRRDDVSDSYEALITAAPANPGGGFRPELQGVSADGSHMVFRANDKLTPDASSSEFFQVYESSGSGDLRLVSVLPDGTASGLNDATAGSVNDNLPLNHAASVSRAVSDDGSRVYWSETVGSFDTLGKIYLRENAEKEQSFISGGECVEPDKACTVPVSNKASEFRTASVDGSRALYTVAEGARAGELDEFNVEDGTSTPVAEKVDGLLGASEDLSYVYFVSSEALSPGAKVGHPNLYLRHEETISFIATLASRDAGDGNGAASVDTSFPAYRLARVTRDGRHIAFVSSASPTGYDNTDAVTGKPDSEVYTYDASSRRLDCVSCDRSGARPTGREVSVNNRPLATAALIRGWETELYPSRALSDDGNRVFFDSYAALVPRDTNGKEDVYEWEVAGSGDCSTQNPAFSAANGGCVSLITSGESPQDSNFVDASPNGNDVFFVTNASLLSQDPGLVDVYDARVDGGFPTPPAAPASCEGEACQGTPVPPNDLTPASASFGGPGDLASSIAGAIAPKRTGGNTAAQVRRTALSKALRACRTKAKAKKRRERCEAAARKRYGANAKGKPGRSTTGRGK